MDEARKFLRYLTPGLSFLFEVFAYFFVLDPRWFIEHFRKISGSPAGLGPAVTLIIASGGVGYLLSLLHHVFYWDIYAHLSILQAKLVVDHTPMLQHAEDMGWLELQPHASHDYPNRKLNRPGAWRIATAIWHERKQISKRIEAAEYRAQVLSDLMHGSGTSLAGAALALLIWFSLLPLFLLSVGGAFTSLRFWLSLGFAFTVTYLHYRAYRRTVEHTEGFANIVISDELYGLHMKRNRPFVILTSPQDYGDEPDILDYIRKVLRGSGASKGSKGLV